MADGEVHFAESPGGLVGFLSHNVDVVKSALVGLDEFFALDKHAAAATAGVKDSAFERLNHGYKQLHDASGRVELSAFFALSIRKLSKEIFVDSAEDVFASAFAVS